jgi:hypothetical protein
MLHTYTDDEPFTFINNRIGHIIDAGWDGENYSLSSGEQQLVMILDEMAERLLRMGRSAGSN